MYYVFSIDVEDRAPHRSRHHDWEIELFTRLLGPCLFLFWGNNIDHGVENMLTVGYP